MRFTALLLVFFAQNLSAFEIYWNVPSQQCKQVHPSNYNILANTGNKFRGEKFIIFYEPDLGLYPWCEPGPNDVKNECQVMINGGVPQNVDINAHLAKVRLDIERAIPNPDYDSLAIIDWERWRPLFDLNWSNRNVYKDLSIKLIQEKYPKMTKYTATYLARFTFDNAAKEFILKTIQTAKEVRPKAKWAFWEYPLCNYDVGYAGELECKPEFGILNEQLLWMFNASDLIAPPIYFYREKYSPELRMKHVYAKILQARELNKKLNKNLPIYAYAKMEYAVELENDTLTSLFYSKADVCSSIKYPSELGIDGVVIWSTSNWMKRRCGLIGEFLNNTLGTFTSQVVRRATKCSQKQCGGRGRCAAKNTHPPKKCELAHQPETMCICDKGFWGENCEFSQSSVVPQTQIEISDLSTPLTTTPFETEDQTSPLRITPSPSTTPIIKRGCAKPTVETRTIDSENSTTTLEEDITSLECD